MKNTFRILGVIGLVAGFALSAFAATTMNGMISDSACGASHAKMMAEHKDAKMTDRDCTLACVRAGGKFVFVSNGKVYNIDNQDLAALMEYTGMTETLQGYVKGQTATVSNAAAIYKTKS